MNADQEEPDELSPEESPVDKADSPTNESLGLTPDAAQPLEQAEVADEVDESASPQDSQDVVFTETSEQVPEQAEVADKIAPEVDSFEAVVVEPNESVDVGDSRPEHTLEDVVALLEQLRKDFSRNQTRDARQQERIDKLHEENVKYKGDLVWSLEKKFIEAFIGEVDDIEKRWPSSKLDEKIPDNYKDLEKQYVKLLRYVCIELRENLLVAFENCGVSPYFSEEGSEFDPKEQRALRTSTTDRPELDKTVKPLRSGYKANIRGQETIVRPELVEVLKYSDPLPDVSTHTEEASMEQQTPSDTQSESDKTVDMDEQSVKQSSIADLATNKELSDLDSPQINESKTSSKFSGFWNRRKA